MPPPRRKGFTELRRAFDEVRFGPERTLNLRASLPTADAAVARAEAWLRQQQVQGTTEVLIVTGRGNRSEGGFSVVRQAVLQRLVALKRKGVVANHVEHTPGSFAVTLAAVQALWESPRRNRGRGAAPPPRSPPSLDELDGETRAMLRDLAARALDALGVKNPEAFLEGEMLRQFAAIASSVAGTAHRERHLKEAIRTALEQVE
jgi:hypothetical protein